jgi:glutathione S-transferase
MIKVFAGIGAWGVPDVSPPCLKLLTYLKMANIPCDVRSGDPRKGPTKKIPYLVDEDGTCIGDSGFIIEHLKKKHGDPLDGRLSASERATGHLIRRTVEDSLYWAAVHSRWLTDEGAAAMRKVFAPVLPPVVGGLVWNMIKGGTRKSAWGQGIARHSPDNAIAIGKADLDALSVTLGASRYLFGDEPTSYDACLYAIVANVTKFPVNNRLTDYARSFENLVAFCDRVEARYWKDSPPAPAKIAATVEAAASP